MMGTIKQKIALLMVCCGIPFLLIHAQPALKTTVDKNAILIGEQVKLKVAASFPKRDFFVKWIELPDSLQHFELVEKSKIDSTFTNQKLTGLAQTFTFTCFDSGRWVLPALNVDFNPASGDTVFNLFTDSLPITVSFQADSTDTIRDIKPIREVDDSYPLWYWIVSGATLLLIILLSVWFYNRYKKSNKPMPVLTSASAYQQAMKAIEELKRMDPSSSTVVKNYHTRIAEIIKRYLSQKSRVEYGSTTTGDLLIALREKGIDKTLLTKVASALRCGDAVKFAKFVPGQPESESALQSIEQVIESIEQLSSQTKQ